MTTEVMLVLLAILSALTSLVTEGAKKILKKKEVDYATNVVVWIVAAILGGGVTVVFYLACGIPWTVLNVIYIFVMIVASGLGAMIGYDKVIQTVTQVGQIVKQSK